MRVLLIARNLPPVVDAIGDYMAHLTRAVAEKPSRDLASVAHQIRAPRSVPIGPEGARILFLVRQLPPALDALGDYTWHLTQVLAKLAVRIEVLTGVGNGGVADGIGLRATIRGWTWRDVPQIVSEVRRARPDVVNWQYTPFLYGGKGVAISFAFLPLLLRLLTRSKIVVTCHEVYFPFRLYPEFGVKALVWGMLQRAELFLIGLASHGLVVTTGQRARTIRRLFSWKRGWIRRLPVGANVLPAGGAEARRATVRAAVGARDDTVVLGVFSTLNQHRSLATIIQAVAMLSAKRDVRLLCLGKIDRTHRVWKEAMGLAAKLGFDSLIHAPGVQSPQDLSAALQALDIYLALYDDGASGVRTTLTTALAHGLPVISTRGASTDADWFVEGENVLFLESPEPAMLADLILRVLEDRQLRDGLRRGAHRSYQGCFSWDVIAAAQLQLMRDVLGCPSSLFPSP